MKDIIKTKPENPLKFHVPTFQVMNQNDSSPLTTFTTRKAAMVDAKARAKASKDYAISVWRPDGKRIAFLTDCASS